MNSKQILNFLGDVQLAKQLSAVEKELLTIAGDSRVFRKPAVELVKSGGKRLRPVLTLKIGSGLNPPASQECLLAATAIELVHLASLVHDDIIDHSDWRRGHSSTAKKLGASQAILLGDFLLAQASLAASRASLAAVTVINQTVMEMTEGVMTELKPRQTADPFNRVYLNTVRQKTAGLFAAAGRLGGLTAGAPEQSIKHLEDYGQNFGTAFQIIDDILDGGIDKSRRQASFDQAAHYCLEARDSLQKLGYNPSLAKLAELPSFYLASTLAG